MGYLTNLRYSLCYVAYCFVLGVGWIVLIVLVAIQFSVVFLLVYLFWKAR